MKYKIIYIGDSAEKDYYLEHIEETNLQGFIEMVTSYGFYVDNKFIPFHCVRSIEDVSDDDQ